VKKEIVPDWLKDSMREHKKNIDLLKFESIDPKQCHCAEIFFLDATINGWPGEYLPDHSGGKMYKEDHTVSLPEFGYYWRKFKDFFKKPFQKMIDKRHRLKHYDSVCKENEKLKKINEGLEHEIWRKGVYLDEAYRLLKNAKKE